MLKCFLLGLICSTLLSCSSAIHYAPAVSKGEKYYGKKIQEKDDIDMLLDSIASDK